MRISISFNPKKMSNVHLPPLIYDNFIPNFFYFPAALLIVAFCYGVSVLKIKTNFHEGRWIRAAAISMLPIYGVWMLICYCAPAHFHDPTTSVAIIILALMILFIVFIPKMYTINQQMKLEDSKEIFYSQQTSINDSTLLSRSVQRACTC